MMNFKVGCTLIGRLLWNVLCFDFQSVQMYGILAYIHFFAEHVEEHDQDERDD